MYRSPVAWLLVVWVSVLVFPRWVAGQLFENLEAFGNRLDVGDPAVSSQWQGNEGPKGITTADLNQDGWMDFATSNLDGTITVYLNQNGETFRAPLHLQSNLTTLRGIVAADFTGDGLPEIVTAGVVEGRVVLFENKGQGAFGEGRHTDVGQSARDLAAGDFDGDGTLELVVAGSAFGLKHLRLTADLVFEEIVTIPKLVAGGFSKPVFPLKVFRRPQGKADELAVTHAWESRVWTLGVGANSALEVTSEVPATEGVYSLDVAPLTAPASSGLPDLITAHRNLGVLEIRKGMAGASGFEESVHQRMAIPGAPRAVRIVDLDRDGWNDLAVVLRYLNRVLTYHNDNGTLVAATEMPVGRSPRGLVDADFGGDRETDLAVINRLSADVSILFGHPGQAGFAAPEDLYLVDGEVAGLKVLDWDEDGRDDVVQLHRASGEVSVRLAGPGGRLSPPTLYPLGNVPSSQAIVDVNNDGFQDAVVANLGVERGSVSVRLGQEDGSLGPEQEFELPAGVTGQLFAVEVADFDGDGKLDLAVGFADCRVGFYKGNGDGSFQPMSNVQFFVYEGRVMVAGDFDQDGDIDLAAAGYAGDLVIAENRGDLFTTNQLTLHRYEAPGAEKFGTRDIKAVDVNDDGDLDLVMGTGEGAMLYVGLDGISFAMDDALLGGTDFPASSVALADFDGDTKRDLAIACKILSCVTVLTHSGDGTDYVPALSVDVPSGDFVAAGDIDGDGHADLVGSGDVLWVALSGRRSETSGPPSLEGVRLVAPGIVINEMLAINNEWPLETDGGRTVDWVELYNTLKTDVSLGGWMVQLQRASDEEGEPPRGFELPQGAKLAPKEHLVVVFSNTQRSPYHTGFRLTGAGGTLRLLNSSQEVVDELVYPQQRENLSYARYSDGSRSFVFNNFPSPGRSNTDNGAVPPVFDLDEVWSGGPSEELLLPPQAGAPTRFFGSGDDDAVIVTASVLYQRLDIPDPEIHRVILFDDGLHEDGAWQDGFFTGILEPGLPPGSEIRFQVEVEDLSDNVITLPDQDGEDFFTLAFGADFPELELSEVVARNDTGLMDENDGTPDWVEVRNCSSGPVSLDGIYLGKHFPKTDNWFAFPRGMTLESRAHVVVFCDGAENQGPLHAPFTLRLNGDTVILAGTAPFGTPGMIDFVRYGPQEPDVAYARQGCGGAWASAVPTPGGGNGPEVVHVGDVDASGQRDVTDAIILLRHLFFGELLSCPTAADANGDTLVDVSDPIHLLHFLFLSGAAPVERPTGCSLAP